MPLPRDRILPDTSTPPMPGSRIAVNLGKTGSGKTWTSRARWWTWPRGVAIDTKLGGGEGEYPGWPAHSLQELEALLKKHAGGEHWRISYRGPTHFTQAGRKLDPVADAEPLFRVLARLESYLLVVEEAADYCTDRKCPPSLRDMAFKGRTRGQALTINSQRPASVAKDLIAEAQLVVAWPLQDPGDREALRDRNFPLEVLDGLEGHESLRLLAPEGERPRFYVCRCSTPHSEVCGDPLPLPERRDP